MDLHCLQQQDISRFDRTRVKAGRKFCSLKMAPFFGKVSNSREVASCMQKFSFRRMAAKSVRHIHLSSESLIDAICKHLGLKPVFEFAVCPFALQITVLTVLETFFKKSIFCLALYTEEVNLQTFVMI